MTTLGRGKKAFARRTSRCTRVRDPHLQKDEMLSDVCYMIATNKSICTSLHNIFRTQRQRLRVESEHHSSPIICLACMRLVPLTRYLLLMILCTRTHVFTPSFQTNDCILNCSHRFRYSCDFEMEANYLYGERARMTIRAARCASSELEEFEIC